MGAAGMAGWFLSGGSRGLCLAPAFRSVLFELLLDGDGDRNRVADGARRSLHHDGCLIVGGCMAGVAAAAAGDRKGHSRDQQRQGCHQNKARAFS